MPSLHETRLVHGDIDGVCVKETYNANGVWQPTECTRADHPDAPPLAKGYGSLYSRNYERINWRR